MTVHAPIPDYEAARQAMVDSQLRPEGVNDPLVVGAMASVARERFVPAEARPIAYLDRAIPIGEGRMLAAPSVLGQLLTEMLPKAAEKGLVVGAGTGYSAAVLQSIGLQVVAVESSPALAAQAKALGVSVVQGPLEAGHKAGAPYDLILLDGAVEYVPDALVDQLSEGGRLGGALLDRGVSRLIVGRKTAGGFGYHSIADAGVAALPGFQRPPAFTF